MEINRDTFSSFYTAQFGALNEAQESGLDALLTAIEQDQDVSDIRWVAYMLATVKHECANTWQPIEEYGKGKGRPYGNPVSVADADGHQYSNVYYGRGYVQLTWKDIYQKMSKALGMDDELYIHPEHALEPDTAYRIMSYGMRNGSFTGKKLGNYINDAGCDYENARRIINGTDQADKISSYAQAFEGILNGAI